ncbi:MAG: DUF445 family protein [Ruminococcus sp.]|nr:DUF445 family protein [Ruminococcus sp.]
MVRIILTLLISAAIGYATNYLAVKMLFRPLKPVYIKGHRLPFTPGIIPKGKPRLAKALSAAVSDSLLTSEDIENAVLSDKSKKLCAEKLCMGLYMRERNKLGQMLQDLSQGCTYSTARQKLKEHIVKKGTQAALDMNAGQLMIDEITAAVKEKTQGSMAAMFITDELIAELTKPAADKLEEYIREKAPEMIEQAAEKELCEIEDKTVPQVFTELNITQEKLGRIIGIAMEGLLRGKLSGFLQELDVGSAAEKHINDMDNKELEELILSVMKKELNAVVRLGALIGLIIGVLNVLVNL